MTEIKYKSIHKPSNSDITSNCSLIKKNPLVYFFVVAFALFLVVLLCPHTITFRDYLNCELKLEESRLSDKVPHSKVNSVPYEILIERKSISVTENPTLNQSTQGIETTLFTSNGIRKETSNVVKTTPLKYVLNKSNAPKCDGFKDNERFDCFPEENVSENACLSRGCCWSPSNYTKGQLGVPFCYYPSNYKSYKYLNVSTTDKGATAYITSLLNSSYPDNVQLVKIDFNYLTDTILQIKIYDANKPRYESPFPKLNLTGACSAANNPSYEVVINKEGTGFNVIRKSNNQSIFNAEDIGGFIFADQMLQLSALLPSKYLYGLGQQRNDFLLDLTWRKITLFNHDMEPTDKANLYGSHPFYLAMEFGGLSSGVLLHNTNAMDIILQPLPAITYRTIGGVLDFFFFLGPSPADVLRQYTQLIGRPFMPPYWSLGFHLCRFGYDSLNKTVEVWDRTRAAGIPFDTQWNDIDYMDRRNDFTYDKVKFNFLPQFVNQLHKVGMHYIVILDPGVSAGEPVGTYPPYDEGLKEGIFVKDPEEDKPFLTKVWNDVGTVFPDFFHPLTQSYWTRQISRLHKTFAFDGLWIDMNDPSTEWSGGKYGCTPNTLENPPYLPAVVGGKLYTRTLCMSARHHNLRHYDVHNIFASQEAVLTNQALVEVVKKRPFVISRSSYPGQGLYSGVWTGDISSTWEDMAHSVSDVLSFSLFGIPMSGADICGFNGNTTEALCQRWSQLGAFYPFSRNHNSIENMDQDPVALGPAVVEAARKALLVRYSLLPYLYTLFWHAHTKGDTVARPMFVEFPNDDKTYALNKQFLWGSGLLIAPQLSEEKLYATAYLPSGRWYDFYSQRPIDSKGSTFLMPSDSDIPLLLKGGHILPTQQPNTTTTASRNNPLSLLVSLCSSGKASGDLYWDDGDSFDYKKDVYNYITLAVADGKLTSSVEQWKYNATLRLAEVKVLGVLNVVSHVTVNSQPAQFNYKADLKLLKVSGLSVDLSQPLTLTWS